MEANTAKRRKLSHGGSLPSGSSTPASSAFVEATQDLLNDVQLDYGKIFEGVDATLRQFKETIETIESHEADNIGNVTAAFAKREKGISIPYPRPRPGKESLLKLAYTRPSQVNIVGSYQLRTMIKSQSNPTIDMIVVMPSSLFQEKDFRDRRYFLKRAYYLACLTSGLRKSFSASFDFNYDLLHGNQLLPTLSVCPKGSQSDKKEGYSVRIIPCAPETLFPPSKLLPSSNNIKDATSPSPYYNSTVRAESLFSSYLRLLNSASKSCAAYRDACVLGRIWLRQRGLDSTASGGGFGVAEWQILVALLLSGGGRKGEAVLSNSLNGSQLFKATIQYLTMTNFQKKPITIGPHAASENLRQNGPVLYDATREHNLLYKMTSWSATYLQQQAKWSLASLKADTLEQFDSLFIVKVDQVLQIFDLVVKLDVPSSFDAQESADYRGPSWVFGEKVYRVLRRALGDRAQLVHLSIGGSNSWTISAKPPTSHNPVVSVGIILNPTHATRKMDLGPSVEQKTEAAKYREFWGDKSELRRFQDGSILESCEWSLDSEVGIPEQIIQYSVAKHLSIQSGNISFTGSKNFSPLAHLSRSDGQHYAAALEAFEVLESEIRKIEDLPLHIRQVTPITSELRYASLHPPTVGKRVPMDVILSFEASGRWSDNTAANQRLKVAFLTKLGESLARSDSNAKIHIGLDQVGHDARNIAFLDVCYDGGFAFRIRVQSDIEEKALESQLKNKQLERHVQIEAAESLAICKHLYSTLPLHTQTIRSLATRHPPLSDTIRLLKQWFSCHKLASHFSGEALELFALRAFLDPYPWQEPTSATTGFLRAIQLLSRWDWPDEPLILDHSDVISASERSAIIARFHELRRQDTRMNRVVLFLATPHDISGIGYTREGPSRVVANQMTKLARSACELVKNKGTDLDPRSLFQSSLKHYDIVIRLHAKTFKALVRDDGSKRSHFKNLDNVGDKSILPLRAHPHETFLCQLENTYSNALVFFYGFEDDNMIGCLWKPELGSRTRKVDMPCAYRPGDEDETLVLDRQSIIMEIARIGGDLIEKIEVAEVI